MRASVRTVLLLCAALSMCLAGAAVAAKPPAQKPVLVTSKPTKPLGITTAGKETLWLPASRGAAPWQKKNWRATRAMCLRLPQSVLTDQICGSSVKTANQLQLGRLYQVDVEGAWNAWNGGTAKCGTFKGVKGVVASSDAQFQFGTNYRWKRCVRKGLLLQPSFGSAFLMSFNGNLFFHPHVAPKPAAPDADGKYSWVVWGLGKRMHFAISDIGGNSDNLGGLTITVTPL